MSRNPPPLPSPDAPANHRLKDGELHDKFDAMLLDTFHVIDDDFPGDWGINDTEEALAVSGVDDSRLKDCTVDVSASVWGVPTMHPAQLEACFRLLHPPRPNSLCVVHCTGGGEDSHPMNSWCDRKGHSFDFYPAAHSLGRHDT